MCKYEKSRVARVIIFENADGTTQGHPREKPRGPVAHIIIMYIVTRLCGLFFKRINTMRPRAYRYVPFTYYFSRKHFYATERKGFWCLLCYYCYVHADAAQCAFHVSTLFFWTVSRTSGYIVTLHARTSEKRPLSAHPPPPGGDHLSAGYETRRTVWKTTSSTWTVDFDRFCGRSQPKNWYRKNI